MGKSKVLTRAQGVMNVVTYARTEQLLSLFAVVQHEIGLGECLSGSAFSCASLRLLCLVQP